MAKRKAEARDIQHLDYRPSVPHPFDLEIFSLSNLRQRATREHMRSIHRYKFYMLLCITHGRSTHMVDFEPVHCKPGSLLVIRPEQAHRFGLEQDWDGWIVLFRPEFLMSSQTEASRTDSKLTGALERLPEHIFLEGRERRLVMGAVFQIREDSRIEAAPSELSALLRHQLYALLLRIYIRHEQEQGQARQNAPSQVIRRFRDFQQLLERNFSKLHEVAEYAQRLKCSEKTLTRATLEVAGVKAKAFISSRINLEAKRLLAHTALPVTVIAERLGFDDPTNFVKFFKRNVGCVPGEFRRKHGE